MNAAINLVNYISHLLKIFLTTLPCDMLMTVGWWQCEITRFYFLICCCLTTSTHMALTFLCGDATRNWLRFENRKSPLLSLVLLGITGCTTVILVFFVALLHSFFTDPQVQIFHCLSHSATETIGMNTIFEMLLVFEVLVLIAQRILIKVCQVLTGEESYTQSVKTVYRSSRICKSLEEKFCISINKETLQKAFPIVVTSAVSKLLYLSIPFIIRQFKPMLADNVIETVSNFVHPLLLLLSAFLIRRLMDIGVQKKEISRRMKANCKETDHFGGLTTFWNDVYDAHEGGKKKLMKTGKFQRLVDLFSVQMIRRPINRD